MRAPDPVLMHSAAGAVLAWGLLACSPAAAQEFMGEVVVSGGAAVIDNPYLDERDSAVTAAATVDINPRLTYDDSVTRVDLSAIAQGKAYADRYDFEDNYGITTALRHRASERVQVRARGAFSSALARGTDLFGDLAPVFEPDQPELPDAPGPLPVDDITTLGQRGRTNAFSLGAGVDLTIDARNRLAFDHSYQRRTFTHRGASDYALFQGEARYTRVLNERTSVGFIAGYQISDYSDPLTSNARSIIGLASVQHRLGPGWSLSASVGANRTRLTGTALRPGNSEITLAARAQLCRRDSREGLCIEYRHQPQPTAFGGVRTSSAASVNYNYRLSETDTVTIGGNYSRSSALDSGRDPVPAATFAGVRARYDKRISPDLSLYAETEVDRIWRDDLSIEPRKMIGVGARYTFGRSR